MIRRWGFTAALVLATGAAAFLRLPDLGNRPFHADEAVHAVKFRDIWERGEYHYDPDEFHGPTLYYAALPIVTARGRTDFAGTQEADYRLATALIGVLMAPMLAFLRRPLGRGAMAASAILLAVAPACCFYSRYFIQEIILAFLTLATLAAIWRYCTTRSPRWAALSGVLVGLMFATKETAVLSCAAWALACLVVRRRRGSEDAPGARGSGAALPVLVGVAAGSATAAVVLSGFMHHPAAVVDAFRAYTPWLQRAHGSDLHRHAWTYYLELLAWASRGGPIVWSGVLVAGLGVIGALVALRNAGRDDASRFSAQVAVATLALLVAYSAIPYKTPWCVLTPLLGLILLAGLGAVWVVGALRPRAWRIASSTVLVLLTAQMAMQARAVCFQYESDPRNPFVYAQTIDDALTIKARAEALAAVHPQGFDMTIKVFWPDAYYWPIPWYLRSFHNVGYWTGVPQDADAPLVLAAPEYDEELTRRLDATHIMNGFIGLRPRVTLMVWVQMDLWTKYVESRPRAPEPDDP